MSGDLLAPQEVTDQIAELDAIVKENPKSIPLAVCAKFLEIKPSALREFLESSERPFGMGWRQKQASNRAFKIPTATFYLWFTNGVGYRKGA